MKLILDGIKDLLSAYLPKFPGTFQPPATEADLEAAELRLGYRLPDDLRELYKIHNGQSSDDAGLFCGMPFLSIEDAMREWETWKEVGEDTSVLMDLAIISVPHGHIQEVYTHTRQFPIAKDHGGNNLCVDLGPDEKGKPGQVINTGRDEDYRRVIAPGIREFLQFILEQVEAKNVKREKDDDWANWYLKRPANYHFLDAVRQMKLPVGVPPSPAEKPLMPLGKWLEGLDPQWRTFLDKSLGSLRKWDQISKIYSLSLLRQEITDLAPITAFKGLRELILSGTLVNDVTPIAGLPLLKTLYLAKTCITSIEPILGMNTLRKLNVANTWIESFDGIGRMKGLSYLGAEATPCDTLDGIAELTMLQKLDVGKNRYQSFGPLLQLRELRELDVSETNLRSLEVICQLPKLNRLNLYATDVTDFTPLRQLVKLNGVTCSFDQFLSIRDILSRKVSFTICGETTEEQLTVWRDYAHSRNID